MKIKALLFQKPWMSAILFVTPYAECMQKNNQILLFQTLQTEVCNKIEFMHFPNEIVIHILSYYNGHKDDTKEEKLNFLIRQYINLKAVCKRFNSILTITTLGVLHRKYTAKHKDEALKKITYILSSHNYYINRLGAMMLLHSGANANVSMHEKYSAHVEVPSPGFSLLHKALMKKDVDLMQLLFKYHANPNQIHPNKGPLFFFAPTIEIVNLFFENGADLQAKDKQGNNVLWHVHRLSLELINFYIEHKVDTRYINPTDSTCILHALANPSYNFINNCNDFYKKGVLLIKIIPDLVNTVDKWGRTPIDVMEKKIEREFYNHSTYYSQPLKRLIVLYREHYGAKTVQELEQEKKLHTNS